MIMELKLIFWILIVSFIISVTCTTVEDAKETSVKSDPRSTKDTQNETCTVLCIHGNCDANGTCICDDGYEKSKTSNLTCNPVCEGTCFFGNCTAPDNCSCHDRWEGKFCNITSPSSVTQPGSSETAEAGSNSTKFNGTKDATEEPGADREPSTCHPECSDQLSNITVNQTGNTTDTIHDSVCNDSACSTVTADSDSSSKYIWINTISGIISCGIIICAAYFLTRKLRERNRMRNESLQCFYNTGYHEMNSMDETDDTLL